jgi:hypothetical protein
MTPSWPTSSTVAGAALLHAEGSEAYIDEEDGDEPWENDVYTYAEVSEEEVEESWPTRKGRRRRHRRMCSRRRKP